ncbi:ParM/StbA family protein [Nostoc sp. CHAB 5834]|nr:ParM/StbA family protein [Nostoc sp. CHAB 5834]
MTYLQAIASSGTITHDITPCGWDCGNGYSKLHTPQGQILIPSYFKPVSDSDKNDYESLGNGALIEYLQGDCTDLVNSKWLIGETAEIYFKQGFGRIVDDWRNKITYGLQMLLGAIALTPRQQNYNLLVVASLHDSQAFAPDLKKALQGQHTVKFDGKDIVNICVNCQIVEEGSGALIVSRAPGQQKIALIDLGHGTTITSVFEGNKLLQNSRKIDTVGVHHLCEAIANNLQTRRHLGKPANPHLIREGLAKNFSYGTTAWEFSSIYADELRGWLASCLAPSWKHLQSRADDLDAVYLIGGGALLANVSAIAARQGIATIPNSQVANVQGLLKLATLKQK